MTTQSVAIVLGTRPEIIKMSPVLRLFEREGVEHFVIHSNQHYSEALDAIFFEELQLRRPEHNLGIGSAEHGNQTGRMLVAIEEILLARKPGWVLAQGDTNTVLAAILAASKQAIPCGHIEAGLRSYDRTMPEEKNRVICDAIADHLFCPTEVQRQILLGEAVPPERIHVTGNTIVDAVLQNRALADQSDALARHGLEPGGYVLLTAHRASTADRRESLEALLALIKTLGEISGREVVYPIHPRTAAKLEAFGLPVEGARLLPPLGYRDFLALQSGAHLIVTDSGGVQEEACILQVPCLTIRENTERPETLDVGANRLVGLDAARVREAYAHFQGAARDWPNPFGDGQAAERIHGVLCRG
ncbi:MAG: UDP-N-acetylglucosamine 2-epimerase (non-hydrolyzing) [Myxococcales bacterium]|nr:UDP-N-acetylglucosamine 2-epimerase (non-hydrolyzing) [Myxococcales bacterium]